MRTVTVIFLYNIPMPPAAPLNKKQLSIASGIAGRHTWLSGPAGSGKTTAAAAGVLELVRSGGIPAHEILILLPQRTLAGPYREILHSPDFPAGGRPEIVTLNGLAQRNITLFWPMLAANAGFRSPQQPPVFLTVETAQYYMARVVLPLLQLGYFGSLSIPRNRLYSQLLDNLNKSAVVGFPHTEIAQRLASAWQGQSSQLRVYEQAQEAIVLFRQYCLDNNLLDFSLQVSTFTQHLWPAVLCRQFLQNRYRHLVFDNCEEDTPAAHDLVADWLPHFTSALVIHDEQAGYRRFLGADDHSSLRLKNFCDDHMELGQPVNQPEELRSFEPYLAHALSSDRSTLPGLPVDPPAEAGLLVKIRPESHRFYPQMLDAAVAETKKLIEEHGVPAGQIAILAPYLSERLRFGLQSRLEKLKIKNRVLRPSGSMRDESYVRCLLTLARLAHPAWGLVVLKPDFTSALTTAIQGMDICRAGLLADIVFRQSNEVHLPGSFDVINAEMKDRISYSLGECYTTLRGWLEAYLSGDPLPLDIFFSRIFGELLTRPGFGFHNSPEAGKVTANLMESTRKFRQAVQSILPAEQIPPEFIRAIEDGLISAQYLRSWEPVEDDAVLVAPAYAFLLQNRPIQVQIWLDTGSNSWYERLEQPLTHPFVLSRQWETGMAWDDVRESSENRASLYRLLTGLLRRCTSQILLFQCELGEQGFDQQGVMIKSIASAFRRVRQAGGESGGHV